MLYFAEDPVDAQFDLPFSQARSNFMWAGLHTCSPVKSPGSKGVCPDKVEGAPSLTGPRGPWLHIQKPHLT
jgi:hypothetical protein